VTVLEEVVEEAERRLENIGPRPEFEPTFVGPIWRTEDGAWLMPEHTIGWDVIGWCAEYLRGAGGDDGWIFTPEQARMVLWWYAVNPTDLDEDDSEDIWRYRDGVIQKVKGWGKDPFAAVICAVELCGPSRPVAWRHPDGTESPKYVEGAEIVAGRLKSEPWVQVFGTSVDQTKNTMSYLQGIFTKKAKAEFGIEVNRSIIYAFDYTARIESVTSAFRTREGNRPSLVVKNEGHHWIESNDGHDVSAVIDRNVNKMRGPQAKLARTLAITNAWDPTEDSDAQRVRDDYDDALARGVEEVFYDSIEAPEGIDLLPNYTYIDENGDRICEYRNEGGVEVMVPPTRAVVVEYLSWLLKHLRGDAKWLSGAQTAKEILKKNADIAEMRRFYLNSIVTGENAYLALGDIEQTVHPLLEPVRADLERAGRDILRIGWSIIEPDEPVVLFFDGSKSDDSTAIVGCRVADGYCFTVGVWEKPKGERGKTWLAPREQVDGRFREAMDTFNVVAAWGDPSHAKDDEDGSRYWDAMLDSWHRDFGDRFDTRHWANASGDRVSSTLFDMATPRNSTLFSEAVVRVRDDFDSQRITWDGHPQLKAHLRNAMAFMGKYGLIIRKPARGSAKKIDAAVCLVGASMLARIVRLTPPKEEKRERQAGAVWIPPSYRRGRR
jgi:hypothetical protein